MYWLTLIIQSAIRNAIKGINMIKTTKLYPKDGSPSKTIQLNDVVKWAGMVLDGKIQIHKDDESEIHSKLNDIARVMDKPKVQKAKYHR
jgi:hypothetical protein